MGRASCAAACPRVADVLLALAVGAASLACGALAPLRLGLAGLAALAAGVALTGSSVVPLLLVTLAPWTVGRLVRSRRRLVATLAERNRALEAERAALAELAVREERARIARELHDIVAH